MYLQVKLERLGKAEFEHMACSLLKVNFSPNPLVSREISKFKELNSTLHLQN